MLSVMDIDLVHWLMGRKGAQCNGHCLGSRAVRALNALDRALNVLDIDLVHWFMSR